MELVEIKGYNMPIHTLPDSSWDETICKGLIPRLMMMLSINLEKNPERIAATEMMIKESANRISPVEIEKAFKLYVLGKLPGLEPMDNHLTPILFNKVVTAYKEQKKPIKQEINTEISEDEKERNAFLNCVYAFDDWLPRQEVSYEYHTAYDELKSRGLMEVPKKDESDRIMELAKSRLLRESATSREFKDAIRKVLNTKEERQWVINYGKCELLSRYFKKIKEQKKHIKDIL
ncbi:hypothetical protein [Flagellimonas sp. SN16]|uniref:hypothetical protein n=1 Tax=Flagellimonas sp. SN16 TaxID=3415142 RepID=UPI003C60C8AE